MRKLFLLRHAKSSWKDASLADFERPLNDRGKKAAEAMGKYMASQQIDFDLVICSPAVRARETVRLLLKAARRTVPTRFEQRIYEADTARLLEIITEIEDEVKAPLMVGHNPGFENLLGVLTGVEEHMPTAALAGITFELKKWDKVTPGGGTLEMFTKARELE